MAVFDSSTRLCTRGCDCCCCLLELRALRLVSWLRLLSLAEEEEEEEEVVEEEEEEDCIAAERFVPDRNRASLGSAEARPLACGMLCRPPDRHPPPPDPYIPLVEFWFTSL